MKQWQLQEAKAHFSEVVLKAQKKPQQITVRGEPKVVVLSQQQYNAMIKPKQSFVEFMRASPLMGEALDIDRDKSACRDIEL